ncbi:MAG TPA: aldehyde dehydrogenase family protein, partial [Gemmatimonadales bacterium]|nr:aldehyde dehydrogenase family protein [Gemmatimonadales bacterium]
MSAPAKITYTSASGDLEAFHRLFNAALDSVKQQAGRTHPFYIGGSAIENRGEPLVDRSPINSGLVLGRFAAATRADVDAAVRNSRAAQPGWGRMPWRQRLAVL